MLALFRRFFDFLIYSNLYIAAASVLMTVESQIQLGMKPNWHPYLFLIMFATLFEYNLHKFVSVFFHKKTLDSSKFGWIMNNLRLFYFIVFASVAGFILTACFARFSVLITLFPLGAITFLYSFPVYKNGVKLFRLREVPLVKIFIISFVWSATCIILPIVQAGMKADLAEVSLMIIERSLFIFAITVPFDIRDMESDRRSGLKTLPLLIGEKNANTVANIVLALFMALSTVHYLLTMQLFILAAFLLSGGSTFVFLNNRRIRSLKEYHYGVLDGTMALQGALVILFYLLASRA